MNMPKKRRCKPKQKLHSAARELRGLRRMLRDARNPFISITDEDFIKIFKFPKHLCKELINEIEPFLESSQRINATPCHIKVLSALRFYASGSFQRALGDSVLSVLSQASYSRCVTDITEALNKIAHRYIQFPKPEMFEEQQDQFYEKYGFPGVIGVVKVTQVQINQPVEAEFAYFCRKNNWYAKKVLIVCDANNLILTTNANFGASYQDNAIWQNSMTRHYLEQLHSDNVEENKYWLLGSTAYSLQPWLMTPFIIPQTATEHRFNSLHAATLNSSTDCINLLKNRFKCLTLSRGLFYNPIKSGLIINACIVLHNILQRAKVPFNELLDNCAEDNSDDINLESDENIELLLTADNIRFNIAQNMLQ